MPLLLTFRTIVAAPAGDNHAPDRGFTHQARFAFPAIDSVLQLKKTLFAVGVDNSLQRQHPLIGAGGGDKGFLNLQAGRPFS